MISELMEGLNASAAENTGQYSSSASLATFEYLQNLVRATASMSPSMSKWLMYRSLELFGSPGKYRFIAYCDSLKNSAQSCQHCGMQWQSSEVKFRTKPRPVLRGSMKKLLRREEHKPWTLDSTKRKRLRRFKQLATMLVYTCQVCGHSRKYPCLKPTGDEASDAVGTAESFSSEKTPAKQPGAGATASGPKRQSVTSVPAHISLGNKERKRSTAAGTPLKEPASVKRARNLLKQVLNDQDDAKKRSSGGLQMFLSSLG
ncbi:unnamed protein product [Ixodes hexagonus]